MSTSETSTHQNSPDSTPLKKRLVLHPSKKRSLAEVFEEEPPLKRVVMEDMIEEQEELAYRDAGRPSSSAGGDNGLVNYNNCAPSTPTFRTVPTGKVPSKKLMIKNFSRKANAAEDLMNASWPTLEASICAIQMKKQTNLSLERLYKVVENVCENKLGGDLYARLQQQVRTHVSKSKQVLKDHISNSESNFLNHLENIWLDYCQQMTMIRDVFLYLDRTYILQNPAVMSIWECSLTIFREIIIDNDTIQRRLLGDILEAIASERRGVEINKSLLKSLLRMLSNLQVYHQVFEREFLEQSTDLFRKEGDEFSSTLSTTDYLRHVETRLRGERSRVDFYLDEATRKPLYSIVEENLICNHMEGVLQKGFDHLVDENKVVELKLLYDLLDRVKDGLTLLKTFFSNYVKRVGKMLVMDPEKDSTMVDSLMQFKNKMDSIVENCFLSQEKFVQAEKDAFDYFVNTRPNKPAELIAKFMDSKLRSANKEASDEELDKIMDRVIVLFRFIQGKDVFEAFYKKDLAKRLLLGRSASVDAEKAMLCKLKQECGPGFTHKLEGMFKDMELSIDLGQCFRQHCEHEAQLGRPTITTDFNVNVLTLGQWPPYEPAEVTIPSQLCRCLQLYQDFYISKHSGRKLQWQHSLGQCVLKATFRPGCVKELQVSLYQGIVLLLFNDCAEFSYQDIQNATKIEQKELKRTLISLACARTKVLTKTPKGKEINDTDKFTVNTELQERLYRIKISQIQMKETEEEHKQTEEQVNQDRQYQIDAAAVRIMKTKKTLSHQQLISELFAQLRFPVKSADLKKRIGSLIERDYMCRDADDPNVYKYVS